MYSINTKQRYFKGFIFFLSLFFVTSSWSEQKITPEDLPPWLKPELLVHLAAMRMNDSQNMEFREGLKECLTGLNGVVKREMRKGGVNIPKRIERGINRQYKKLDERMRISLQPSQIESWELYLDGLKKVMSEGSMKKTSESEKGEFLIREINHDLKNAALSIYKNK